MSSTIRFPATEKPWHGGPPIMMSIDFPFRKNRVSEGSKLERSACKTWLVLWLCLKVHMASFHTSIPNNTLKPALSNPREKPPQPQKRSITFGAGFVIKVKNISWCCRQVPKFLLQPPGRLFNKVLLTQIGHCQLSY